MTETSFAPTRARIARVLGRAPDAQMPAVPVASPANDEPAPGPRSKPDFAALERLSSYWRGRANGRQAAVDFYRGEACQRDVTAAVDTSHDLLRDHACIAEYEKQAANCEKVRS